MRYEGLNKTININPAEKKKKKQETNKPRNAKIGILYVNMIFQTTKQYRVILAVSKSTGFTGIPARFAKSRLLHSKQ